MLNDGRLPNLRRADTEAHKILSLKSAGWSSRWGVREVKSRPTGRDGLNDDASGAATCELDTVVESLTVLIDAGMISGKVLLEEESGE